jgi:hypothetical protein
MAGLGSIKRWMVAAELEKEGEVKVEKIKSG